MCGKIMMSVGYESTPIDDSEFRYGRNMDVLDMTRHYEQFEYDFDLQEKLGIKAMRYHTRWNDVLVSVDQENANGVYDWSPLVPIYDSIRRRGFELTADLCHHKVPRKIARSFANPAFPEIFCDYAMQVQKQFPWIKKYSLINEAAVTALFHCTSQWGSYHWSDVFMNMAKATSLASRALKAQDPEIDFVYPEPIDHDVVEDPNDPVITEKVEFLMQWGRFGMDDLLQGKIEDDHRFFQHLVEHGARPEKILWFRDNPAESYVRGLDFYVHCFKVWRRDPNTGLIACTTNLNPPPLSEVIKQYRDHMPETRLAIGETNTRGTVRDRITFWVYTMTECLKAGLDSYAWWGLTDADCWGSGNYTTRVQSQQADPVGIYTLSDHPEYGRLWTRQPNEFSRLVELFVKGQIDISDIPCFEPSGELKEVLTAHATLHMPNRKLLAYNAITKVA
ncbi:MAG: family 1 glycosylhydrolase [Candidatus Doudnabacteria bacterium]|nr:family 1 glycosylhydrolase [Candidatus Doudnabacteria bacterium]